MPLRSPWSQRAVIALTGAGALAGYLLASGAAAPVVADVVALTSRSSSAEPSASADDGAIGTTVNGTRVALSESVTGTFDSRDTWMDNDNRAEWSPERLVPQGPAGADAAQPPVKPQTPDVQVPEDPKGRNLFTTGAPMRRYELKGPGACPQGHGKGLYVQHFGAEPGVGSATVSWWDLGDPSSTEYQIDAVSVSDSGSVTTQTIPAPKTCKDVSLTFSGLKSGTSYVFMLTATNVSPEEENRIYRIGRGQTAVIVVK